MSVKIIVAASCAALFIAPALAQTQRDSNTPPAVATPSTPPPAGAPVSGANSFTEGATRSLVWLSRHIGSFTRAAASGRKTKQTLRRASVRWLHGS
jgi:hypothetical protein